MEQKTLILGLFFSFAAFGIKAGGGLAYLFLQTEGPGRKGATAALFALVWAVVFAAAALILMKVDLVAHLDVLQAFFKSGMTLHFLLALLLIIWGVRLLLKDSRNTDTSRGWIPLVIPCPVCFSVILLSGSFVAALYPEKSGLVLTGLYLGFVLISFAMAAGLMIFVKGPERAGTFLGTLMLYIAGYFILSVLIIPNFADLERIYRISSADAPAGISQNQIWIIIICAAAFLSGLGSGIFQSKKRE